MVVIDISGEVFLGNRILDMDYARQFPGAEAMAALGSALAKRGLETVTADVYLERYPHSRALVVSHESTEFTDRLLCSELSVPCVCMSLESPIMAVQFYRSIPEVSQRYRHLFLWPGARERAKRGAVFHDISWPYPNWSRGFDPPSWEERRFLVMVNSNKRAFAWPTPWEGVGKLRPMARTLRAAAKMTALRLADPWFRSELYVERLRAIRHFAQSADFDLYGRGWVGSGPKLAHKYETAVNASYRGEIPALGKLQVLGGYRFSLCLENTVFPGYVTEKIFDCMIAGCIPVYLGAPDIDDLVPPGCFVDMRDFGGSLSRLESFLRSMGPSHAKTYLERAREFLAGSQSERFTQRHLVTEMVDAIVSYAADARPR